MTAFVTGPLGAPLAEIAHPLAAALGADVIGNARGSASNSTPRQLLDDLLLDLGGTDVAPPFPCGAELLGATIRRGLRAALGTLSSRRWIWADHRLSLTMPIVQDALDVKFPVILHCPAPTVKTARELALSPTYVAALWERYVRLALSAAAGCPVHLSLGPLPGSELSDLLDRWAGPAKAGILELPDLGAPSWGEAFAPTDQQIELFTLLEEHAGPHDCFPDLDLGAESPGTADLIDARRSAAVEAARTSAVLERAVDALEVLASPPRRRELRRIRNAELKSAAVDLERYHFWLEQRAGALATEVADAVGFLSIREVPTLRVVIPVGDDDSQLLAEAVASALGQPLPPDVVLVPQTRRAERVCHTVAGEAGDVTILPTLHDRTRAAALAAGAAGAVGGYLTTLGPRDRLAEGALALVLRHLVEHPDHRLVYTDEDVIDSFGVRGAPYFKPDFSPELLHSSPYATRLLVIAVDALQDLGGFRSGVGGSEEYDLVLRAARRERDIGHVRRICYHRRGPLDGEPPAITAADLEAVRRDVAQEHGEAVVERGLHDGTIRVRRTIIGQPKVTIIVPFRDQADLLRRCVESVHETAGYAHWDLLLMDNGSWEPETSALVERLRLDPRCRVIDHPHPFNWSEINNVGTRATDADLFLFMNSDVEGLRHGWLSAMIEHAQRPGVGVVGARLLYPDGRVQHAGVVLGLGAWVAWHAFVFLESDDPGYYAHAVQVRNYSAVTGACMMVSRRVFDALGGFDERLGVAFNDVDFCLRARQQGHRIVYTPFAELVHHEGASRGRAALELDETQYMVRTWGHVIREDPYFNENLDPSRSEFALPLGTEQGDPWDRLFSTLES